MSKTSFIRYVWLVSIIRQYGHITLSQIQDEWRRSSLSDNFTDLPRRTFASHKDAIEEMFGIKIKVNGYNQYYIAEEEDTTGLHNVLLDSFAIKNIFSMVPSLEGRILYENVPSGHKYLVSIVESMKMSRKLAIHYHKFGTSEPNLHYCNPLALKTYRRRWYLIAQDSENTDYIFPLALDRISSLEELDETFFMPKGFDAQTYLRNCVGMFNNNDIKPEKIVFRTTEIAADYVRTLPFHHSQKELRTEDGWVYFELFVKPTYDLKQQFIEQMDGLEVMEPLSLRNSMAEIAESILKRYSKQQ